jgi:DNA repair protein RecO (recombination protein O)
MPRHGHAATSETIVAQERAEAIVLRGVDFSETSRIVTFLSPDRGLLACMAKGARRRNSPLGSVLDTLNRVELVYYWKDGRSVQPLGEAALIEGYGALKGSLEKATYAAFPVEIVCKVAHENEPSRGLFGSFVRGLDGLAVWPGNVRTHACWQALQLLAAAGFAPALDACAECARPVAEAAGFSYAGGVTCASCRSDRRIGREEHASLRALMLADDACPAVECPREVFGLLRHFAARQLETDFRSVRVIEEMLGGQ